MYTSTTEHAKQIRNEIKAAIKAGKLPAGIKVSTRSDSYSMGSSISVYVKALPEGFVLMNPTRVAFEAAHPHASYWDLPTDCQERHTAEGRELLAKLEAIVNAHHDDRSIRDARGGDTIYNVNFHKHIAFDGDVEGACRKRTLAKLAAEAAAVAVAAAPVAPVAAAPAEKPRYYLRAVAVRIEGT